MSYDVNLDLSPSDVKALKQVALDKDTTMRGLLTQAAKLVISDPETKSKITKENKN